MAKKLGENDYDVLRIWLWLSFAISVVLCAVVLKVVWDVVSHAQIAISVVAFVLYVAAIGGPFATLDWYDPLIGVFAAAVASAFLAFVPTPQPPE